jgi:acyl-CoA thioesterase
VRFDQAIESRSVAPGRYSYTFDGSWFGLGGPHGGFLVAVILRAMQCEVEPERHPRSLTVHFPARINEGDVDIEVREERRGGRMSSLSARVTQDGNVMALALGAFSIARDGPDITDAVFPGALPEVFSPEAVTPTPERPQAPAFARHFDYRPVIGGLLFRGGSQARSGGWMRFKEPPALLDAPAIACFSDAWMPAIFTRIDFRAGAPTVDLTVHFRSEFPTPGLGPEDFVLGVFRSQRLESGFWEEDGELWTPDGRLIAQSRQLALLIPMPKD